MNETKKGHFKNKKGSIDLKNVFNYSNIPEQI